MKDILLQPEIDPSEKMHNNHRKFGGSRGDPRSSSTSTTATNAEVNPLFILSVTDKLAVMEAMDHMRVMRQYQEMGSCTVCKKISVRKCSGCNSYYCSIECQAFDWPKHRSHCNRQRDCASERESFATGRQMRGYSSIRDPGEGKYFISERGSPFTALANQVNRTSRPTNSCMANFRMANQQNQQGREQNFWRNSEPGTSAEGRSYRGSNGRKKFSSPRTTLTSVPGTTSGGSSGNNDNYGKYANTSSPGVSSDEGAFIDIVSSYRKKKKLPMKLGKTEVIATYRESSDRYWVINMCDLRRYHEIQEILNRDCRKYHPIVPQVGLICACKFEDDWYRVEIIATDPEIIIHYLDYGNFATAETEVFKKLPDHLITEPGLVFLIEFDEHTPLDFKMKDMVCIKILVQETSRTMDGAVRVTVYKEIEDDEGKPLSKLHSQKTEEDDSPDDDSIGYLGHRAVMDSIGTGETGMVFFVPGEEKVRFASILPQKHLEANACIEKVMKIEAPNCPPISAKVGDWVLVTDREGNDQRGKVVLKYGPTYYVRLVDCGHNLSVENVYPLQDDLKKLIYFGVRITVEHVVSLEEMRKTESAFYTVTGEAKDNKWPATLKDGQSHLLARVFLIKPGEIPDWQPEVPQLGSGATVEVTSMYSTSAIYIRPVDVQSEQLFLDLNMEIGQYAATADRFTYPPQPGELCCAKYKEDNCYYRAIVHSLDEGVITILFVDFGRQQVTPIRDIKPIPDSLKRVPFFALKVLLKDVSVKQWNNMIMEYIRKLIRDNVELTMTYDDSMNNGVVLREKVSGVIVNEFIENSRDRAPLAPQPIEPREQIFLEDDLTYTKLTPGTKCILAILFVCEEEFLEDYTFWATSVELENFNHVNLDLNNRICEYCAKSAPYRPTYRELCIGEYEDSWYRAVCLGGSGDTFKVFFVDFGNICELKSNSIRRILKDFVISPALAVRCVPEGHCRMDGKSTLTKKVLTTLMNRVNTFIEEVTVVSCRDDRCALVIPEVEALLLE